MKLRPSSAEWAWGTAIAVLLTYELYAVIAIPHGTLSEWVWLHAQPQDGALPNGRYEHKGPAV